MTFSRRHTFSSVTLLILLCATLAAGCANAQEKQVRQLSEDFLRAIDPENPSALASMADDKGIWFELSFLSGNGTRGHDVSEILDPSKLPSDLTFGFVKDEYPISLRVYWQMANRDVSRVRVMRTKVHLDWENINRESLIRAFAQFIGDEQQPEGTRIYVLNDGSFCLGEMEGGPDIQGSNWAVFRKQDEGYTLVALVFLM